MRDNKAIGAVAGVISLGSVLGLVFSLSGGFGPRTDGRQFEFVGQILARQALGLLKPGGQITVITRDTVTFQNPASDFQLAGFRAELARSGHQINSIQSIQIDPLRPLAVPPGDFFQWIKRAGKGDVLVSFMGPPQFTDAQILQLAPVQPAIVAFCSGPARDQDLRSLFSQGLLQAAVVSKRPSTIQRRQGLANREAFDNQYLEVTSANLGALAVLSSSGQP